LQKFSKLDALIQPQLAQQFKEITHTLDTLKKKYEPGLLVDAIEHSTRILAASRSIINFYSFATQIPQATDTSLDTQTLLQNVVFNTLENLIATADTITKQLTACIKEGQTFVNKNKFSSLLHVGKTKRPTVKIINDLFCAHKLADLIRRDIDFQVALIQQLAPKLNTNRDIYEKKSATCTASVDVMMKKAEEITVLQQKLVD
jgi:hypothetical protein